MIKFPPEQGTCSDPSAHKPLYPTTCRLQIVHKWKGEDVPLELGTLTEISGPHNLFQQQSSDQPLSQTVNFMQHKITKKNRFKPSNFKDYYLKWSVESPSTPFLLIQFLISLSQPFAVSNCFCHTQHALCQGPSKTKQEFCTTLITGAVSSEAIVFGDRQHVHVVAYKVLGSVQKEWRKG